MQEVRNTHNETVNSSTDKRTVEGYAVVFNSESVDLGGFTEIIEEGALDGVIEKSDVLCLLDHKTDRGVLARSTNGEGSLKLEIDKHGLKYSFEAPHTALGDEILEGIKRGDIRKCSFGFIVDKDEWIKRNDGTVLRKIKKIKQLVDVSLVFNPAYEQTEVKCDTRGLKALQEEENKTVITDKNKMAKRSKEDMIKQLQAMIAELQETEENVTDNEVREEEVVEDKQEETTTEKEEVVEENKDCETDKSEEENREDEEVKQEENEVVEDTAEEQKQENNNEIRNINTSMKFSLIQTINDVVNNRGLSDVAKEINKEGRSAMVKAGLAANGNITIPVETRAEGDTAVTTPNGIMATVATQGKENVATDKLNILEPLRANMVLAKAGATYMTGLVGDVSIPVYSGSNVGWKGEVVAADNGEGAFSEVILQPKRLTAFVDVSKQFLIQDSNDAEEMLKRDIINAIGEKLEMTILGTDAGDATKPAGVFNGVTADSAVVKFGDIVDLEAELEDANVNDYVYIVSPTAKAILRKTSKDSGSGQFIMADGEIEGRDVYVSSAVAKKGVIVGDFKDYVVAQWGALDLTIDQYTKAADGMVRLVINAYFDAKPRRATAFAKRILK